MVIQGIEARCGNCDYWQTKDAVTGVCENHAVGNISGYSTIVTGRISVCPDFEPSTEAVNEHLAEVSHWAEMFAETQGRAW